MGLKQTLQDLATALNTLAKSPSGIEDLTPPDVEIANYKAGIKQLQDENAELRRERDFYRELVEYVKEAFR